DVTLAGMSTEPSAELKNAEFPIVLRLLFAANVIEPKAVHPMKALLSMEITPAGMLTLVMLWLFENALPEIAVTVMPLYEAGIVRSPPPEYVGESPATESVPSVSSV
ncbi:MAG: hypothetical protein WC082_15290, partial [Victivallales bacterium]